MLVPLPLFCHVACTCLMPLPLWMLAQARVFVSKRLVHGSGAGLTRSVANRSFLCAFFVCCRLAQWRSIRTPWRLSFTPSQLR